MYLVYATLCLFTGEFQLYFINFRVTYEIEDLVKVNSSHKTLLVSEASEQDIFSHRCLRSFQICLKSILQAQH